MKKSDFILPEVLLVREDGVIGTPEAIFRMEQARAALVLELEKLRLARIIGLEGSCGAGLD